MPKLFAKLSVTPKTRKMIVSDCVKEYLKHHPEMRNIEITQDKIAFEVARYYLDQ
jgi:hypothetical protein